MLMVLFVALLASALTLPMLPDRYREPAQLLAALGSLAAAIVTGFYQAKQYPKAKTHGTLN